MFFDVSPLASHSNNWLIKIYCIFFLFALISLEKRHIVMRMNISSTSELILKMKLENSTFVPGTGFADVNLLWSISVKMSWYSFIFLLKNTDISVKFLFVHWYRASAVKIGFLKCWTAPLAKLMIFFCWKFSKEIKANKKKQ